MRIILGLFMGCLFFSACVKNTVVNPQQYSCNLGFADSSAANAGNAAYQSLLKKITGQGVAGIMMSVYKPAAGMWTGAAGMADINNKVAMQPCHTTRMGSVIKTFTATVLLQMQQNGIVDLDDKISAHLQHKAIKEIKNADVVTIRQCLQHSSGLYNYIQSAQFQTASLNDLTKVWTADDLLKYAYGKPAYFAPGQDAKYSNTNYILLGLLIEKLEGKPLYKVFDDRIFVPLQMTHTLFAAKDPVPKNIAKGYADLYSRLELMETTQYSGWDYYTADGGLLSNPYDVARFFKALMEGQLINAASLTEMLHWKTSTHQDADFYNIEYGLGIFKAQTSYGTMYFHSGDAIGYDAGMFYLPATGTYAVYAANSNYGKISELTNSKKAIDEMLHTVQ